MLQTRRIEDASRTDDSLGVDSQCLVSNPSEDIARIGNNDNDTVIVEVGFQLLANSSDDGSISSEKLKTSLSRLLRSSRSDDDCISIIRIEEQRRAAARKDYFRRLYAGY